MTEVQHQPERKTRPAGLLEDIESIRGGDMLSTFDIFNLKRALKALGYYDGRVNKEMDNDLKYAITLFQLEHRLIMTREDAQAGQWNEPLKDKLVSVLDRETDEAPEAPARSRNAVDPNDPAAVQVTTRGKIGNGLKQLKFWGK
jgi:hypothetical protein